MTDTYDHMNEVNLSIQGPTDTVLDVTDNLCALTAAGYSSRFKEKTGSRQPCKLFQSWRKNSIGWGANYRYLTKVISV